MHTDHATTDTADRTFSISPYQAAVYEDVRSGTGHTVVCARAGSGKTTTIMGALASVPKGCTIALFAFNKTIALELEKERAKKGLKGVEVKTLHSHGFSAIRRAFPDVRVDDDKSYDLACALFGAPQKDHPVKSVKRYKSLAELVKIAKDTLAKKNDLDNLDRLVDTFDIDAPEDRAARDSFLVDAMAILIASIKKTDVVDFADMCWLPVVLRLRVWAFDRVFVDETQDLSPSQIELLLLTVKRGGRICAVGDDRQAIYAFRGADIQTIPNLIARLDAKVLPLSVTYRCCRSVVRLAQTQVPDLEPAPHAVEGAVSSSTSGHMYREADAGDMIISRSNAPLMKACLHFLRMGKRAAIKGRDVGAAIVRLIERSKATTPAALTAWLDAWEEKEIARCLEKDVSSEMVEDKAACIRALMADCTSIADVKAKAERLFVANDGGEDNRITLGTTHRLKGLEAERVWLLEDTYRASKGGEEANVWYVAVTRAKTDLRRVRDPKDGFDGSDDF